MQLAPLIRPCLEMGMVHTPYLFPNTAESVGLPCRELPVYIDVRVQLSSRTFILLQHKKPGTDYDNIITTPDLLYVSILSVLICGLLIKFIFSENVF